MYLNRNLIKFAKRTTQIVCIFKKKLYFCKKYGMLFGLIFSILTATYTLSSTTTVEGSGDVPAGSTYKYERSATTGQKGQMTSGNSTRLYLSGWQNCQIQSIALRMRSNTDSGAGALQVTIDDVPVWIIDNAKFSERYWAGEYSTNWMEIKKDLIRTVNSTIDIQISASANSLYIDSYSISYTVLPPTCYTVTFHTGLDRQPSSISQNQIGEPIILPTWQDTALWNFVGWSEKEIEENTPISDLFQAGSSYTPRYNTTLWAVYSDRESTISTTNYQSGEYIISMHNAFTESLTESGMALEGGISNGHIPLCKVEMQPTTQGQFRLYTPITEEMIYQLDFTSDSTLHITHSNSQTPIGHKDNKLFPNAEAWEYKQLNDNSLGIAYTYKNRHYALFFGIPNMSDEAVAYAQGLDIEKWEEDGMYLFPVLRSKYTSWPFGKYDSVEQIYRPDISDGILIRIGTHLLYIKNGKKYLLVQK